MRGAAAAVVAVGLALGASGSRTAAAENLVVDGGAVTIETDRSVAGSVYVQNGGILTIRNATLTLQLDFDDQFHVDVSGGSRLILENATITSTGGQYWLELRTNGASRSTLSVSGEQSRITNHSGIRPFGRSVVTVTGGDVEELQLRDQADVTVQNAATYPVLFFVSQTAVLNGLSAGASVDAQVSLPGGWTFALSRASVEGYQIDLLAAADVTVRGGDGIVLSLHTPGNLAGVRVLDGLTSDARTSGSVTELGSRFVYEDTNVALVNVYASGTDQILLKNLHVNEVNAEENARVTIGQPGTSTKLNCNLCQVYDHAALVVDSATIDATGNLPSATSSYHDRHPAPGAGLLAFRNMDLRSLDLTAREAGTIDVCGSRLDRTRTRVLDAAAKITESAACWEARSDGAQPLYAPASPRSAQNAAFSPDGTTLLFTVFDGGYNLGSAGLYRLPLSGSSSPSTLLFEADQAAVNLPGTSWNGPARRIVFAFDRLERDEIWTMKEDGTDLFRVTNAAGGGTSLEGSFSPDGQWIAFESFVGLPDTRLGSIWKARADGSGLTRLTSGFDDRQPNWSPRGDRILCQRRASAATDFDVVTMATDGTDVRAVTASPWGDTDASWSPDGAFIVYSSDFGGLAKPNLFVVRSTGGTPTRVTRFDGEDAAPSFSPDGRDIAFESHATPTAPSTLWSIAAPALAPPSASVVPLVLDVSTSSARYTTELFLTNPGAAAADLTLRYTPSFGTEEGPGTVTERLAAKTQTRIRDAIDYLRRRGLAIPASGPQGGTLLVTSSGGNVYATARTATPTTSPVGRAGLAYSALAPARGISTRASIYGLRSTAADRSNLALFNPGPDAVTVKVTAVSGSGDGSRVPVSGGVTLPAYGFSQIDGVLAGAGLTNGWVELETTSGGAFGAYAVVNDNVTNDGSFLLPSSEEVSRFTLPVLVETVAFRSELFLANADSVAATVTLRYAESLSKELGAGGAATVTLAPGEQRIVPEAIDFLRASGVSIGARGAASYAGAVRVKIGGASPEKIGIGARTASLAPSGGAFGLFTPGVTSGEEPTTEGFLFGLAAVAESRANVAVLATGEDGAGPVTLQVSPVDGVTGEERASTSVTLQPGEWRQLSNVLGAVGITQGYVRLRRTAGSAPWTAYGVVNDGARPGERTGDGAWIPLVVNAP